MNAALVEVHPDPESLATAVAGELLSRISSAQEAGRRPQFALCGGRIADRVHREIARLAAGSEIDWSQVGLWWGDERWVAPDSADRNAVQARDAFITALAIPEENVHEMPSSASSTDLADGAAAYADLLRKSGGGEFEVVLLGLGEDGHIASLFPGQPTLAVEDRIAVAVHDSPKPPAQRISLTFAAINRSRSVWLLVSGAGKAEAVGDALREPVADEQRSTARLARPSVGVRGQDETVWFLDREAASRL